LKQRILFAFITKFLLYAKIGLVLLFGSIYQYFTFFANSYLFYLVLFLKMTLFNTVLFTVMGKSHEIVIKMLRVEKVGAHAAF